MKKLITVALLLCQYSAYSFVCSTPPDVEKIAKEMIMQELSGLHISGLEKSACLKQEHFPLVKVVYDPSTENFLTAEYLVESKGLKLDIKTELRDKDNQVYRATYTVPRAMKVSDGKFENITDKIEFYLYTDIDNQKKYGCAAIVLAPAKRVLLSQCQKK